MRVNKRMLDKRAALVFRVLGRRSNTCSYLARVGQAASRTPRAMLGKERPACALEIGEGANRIWSIGCSSGDVRRLGLAFSPRDHGPYQVFAMAKACQRNAAYMEKDQHK